MNDDRSWRIDDLAHDTGLTVDTIRYYQREGLLPPGERQGRHRIYGPEHIRRIKRIKELQARRFSIAAIRALVSGSQDRLSRVFTDVGEDLRLTFAELLEQSGASPELAVALQGAGILRDPHDFGRTAYDGDDLEMMRSMAELEQIGVPATALGVLGYLYAQGIEAMQRRIVDAFEGGADAGGHADELARFQEVAGIEPDTVLPSMRRLVDYTHHRTLQRLALETVERGADPDPASR
jgi:DNA-binding transcriptional MerR regulator